MLLGVIKSCINISQPLDITGGALEPYRVPGVLRVTVGSKYLRSILQDVALRKVKEGRTGTWKFS